MGDAIRKLPYTSKEKIKIALFKDPSLLSLIFSNLLVILFAIIFNWDIMVLLWIYWSQSVIIGFFNFFRILSFKQIPLTAEEKTAIKTLDARIKITALRPLFLVGLTIHRSLFLAGFFAFHYGLFHYVYATFLMFFTKMRNSAVDIPYILLMAGLFFANHLYSFIYNKECDKKKQNIFRIMYFPYFRIIPMHLTIIFGGIFLAIGIGRVFLLIFFLLLKTFADVGMHLMEHK